MHINNYWIDSKNTDKQKKLNLFLNHLCLSYANVYLCASSKIDFKAD